MVGADATAYRALFERLGVRQVDSIPCRVAGHAGLVLDRLGGTTGERRLVSPELLGWRGIGGRRSQCRVHGPGLSGVRRRTWSPGSRDTLGGGEATDLVSVSNPLDYHTFIWGDPERLKTGTFTAVAGRAPGRGDTRPGLSVGAGLDDSGWWPTLECVRRSEHVPPGCRGWWLASMAENLPPEVEVAADRGRAWSPSAASSEALEGTGGRGVQWGGRRDPIRHFYQAGRRSIRRTCGPCHMMGDEARSLLEAAGVPVPRVPGRVRPSTPLEACGSLTGLGYPVVVKATGMAHKTEAGSGSGGPQ